MRSAHTITAMTVGLPVTIRAVPNSRAHTVVVGDQDIAGAITAMTVSYDGTRLARATVELALDGIDIDEPATVVEIGEQTRALLTRLGWTPPPGDQP